MNNGKYPYFIGGGLLCLYSLLLLISNILMLTSPGFELTAGPFTFLFIQITPEGFALLYVFLPVLIIILFVLTVILRERWFYSRTSIWVLRIPFLCVAINAAVTYTAPEAIGNMYESLQVWSGIDLFGLFGQKTLWIAALFAAGCYLALSLGFHLNMEHLPAPYLITRTVSLAVVIFVWIPVLMAHDSLNPGRTIVKPLLVVFCLLYYILFENLRSKFGKLKDADKYGRRKYSIVKLLITTVIMAVVLIPYLHTVYLFTDSWATFWLIGFIVFIIAFGKGGGGSMEEVWKREREAHDRWVSHQRQEKEHRDGYQSGYHP